MPSPERFSKVRRLLEAHGWILTRISGSHHVFTKAGRTPLSIPVHQGKVKPFYVRQVRKIIQEEAGDDDGSAQS